MCSVTSHVVMLENEIQKFFSSASAQGVYSGELSLLTEAAIVSGSEEQSFKHGSPSHVASVPALSQPTKRDLLGAQ